MRGRYVKILIRQGKGTYFPKQKRRFQKVYLLILIILVFNWVYEIEKAVFKYVFMPQGGINKSDAFRRQRLNL
jgi:hypothetical protein